MYNCPTKCAFRWAFDENCTARKISRANFKTNALDQYTRHKSHYSIWKLNTKQSNACTMRLKNNNGATMNTHICSMVIWNCASNNRISLHPTYDCVQMDLDFGKGYTRLNVLTITYGNREYGQKRLNANRMQAKNERTEQTSELLMIKHQSRSHTNYHTHSTHTYVYHTQDTGDRET